MLANTNLKKQVEHIGVSDCDSMWCSKLDPVIQAIMLNEATKADDYMSHLQQFQLDVTALLMAIIEIAEEGILTTEMAVPATQMALFQMGNIQYHMAQEGL